MGRKILGGCAYPAYNYYERWAKETFLDPTLGIDFGSSQVTTVLRWPNGTIEQSLSIQGGVEYHAAILDTLNQYNSELSKAPDLNSFAAEATLQQQMLNDPQDPCASLQLSFNSFKEASKQISRHIATTISTPISMLGISSPVFLNPQQQACLRFLVTQTGLHGSLGYHQTSSTRAAAAANHIGMCACPYDFEDSSCDDTPAMVLSVDYTDVALTILTYRNFYEWHDGGMVFAIATSRDRDVTNGTFCRNVMDAMKSILDEAVDNKIDRIIFSGPLASDSNLHRAILWSLGGGYALPVRARSEQSPPHLDVVEPPMADPEIAAAQGVADLAWQSTIGSNGRWCMDPCAQRRRLGLPQCLWETESRFDPFERVYEESHLS